MRVTSLLVSIVFLSFISCELNKQSHSSKSDENETVTGIPALVTTKYADEGCPVLLEIEEDGQKVFLMPVELDEKFRENGTKISIQFHFSKIMQSDCQLGRPIVLDDIVLAE